MNNAAPQIEVNESAALTALAPEAVISTQERNRISELYLGSAFAITSRPPLLIASAGNIAAGKTYLLRHLSATGQLPGAHALRHDPDAVMSEIPEYREQTCSDPAAAFNRWEIPARELADQILEQGLSQRLDVIYDRTCAFPETVEFLKGLKQKQGYRLQMYFSYASLEECLARALKRAKIQRRFVPPQTIVARAASLRNLLKAYRDIVDELFLYSNHDDVTPRLIATYHNGEIGEVKDVFTFERIKEEYSL